MSKKAKVQAAAAGAPEAEEVKKSNHVTRVLESRKKGIAPFPVLTLVSNPNLDAKIDPMLESQFAAGRLYAAISSRPGQSGRGDGYILEGKELEVSLRARSQYPVLTLLSVLHQEDPNGQAEACTRCMSLFCFCISGWALRNKTCIACMYPPIVWTYVSTCYPCIVLYTASL